MEESGTVSCPHCGGEIRAAAKVCKHCKRSLGDGTAATTAAPSAAFRDALARFVADRGAVARERVQEVFARHATGDGAALLGHLATAGVITQLHVETLRDAFRDQQRDRAAKLIEKAALRGLLSQGHAEAARHGFQGVVFAQTPEDYLTGAQYLTAAQIATLGGSSSSSSAGSGARALWDRVRTDPKIYRPLLAGPVAMLVTALLIATLGRGRGASGDWLYYFAFVPIVAVLVVVWKTATVAERIAWGTSTAITFVLGMFLADLLGLHGPPYVARIAPHCTMDGHGYGTCTFTNVDIGVAASCGYILATCTPRGGVASSLQSEPICSGPVPPGQTRRMNFDVAGFDRIRSRAVPYYGDWRNFCSFDWVPQ